MYFSKTTINPINNNSHNKSRLLKIKDQQPVRVLVRGRTPQGHLLSTLLRIQWVRLKRITRVDQLELEEVLNSNPLIQLEDYQICQAAITIRPTKQTEALCISKVNTRPQARSPHNNNNKISRTTSRMQVINNNTLKEI